MDSQQIAVTVVRFSSDPTEITAGAYRDYCGRLVDAESEYVDGVNAIGVSPRYSTPDIESKLPRMSDIYTSARLRAILKRPEIDLTGYDKQEVYDAWKFNIEAFSEPEPEPVG